MKIARKWGKLHRDGAFRIITADRSFHGRTLTTVTATGQPKYQELRSTPLPEGFRPRAFGDLEAVEQATGHDTVAVMLEPIMGESGVVMAPDGYFAAVRAWCDEQNLLLILDEVQTGLYRTAGLVDAFQHEGIQPDVMTLARRPSAAGCRSAPAWRRRGPTCWSPATTGPPSGATPWPAPPGSRC